MDASRLDLPAPASDRWSGPGRCDPRSRAAVASDGAVQVGPAHGAEG